MLPSRISPTISLLLLLSGCTPTCEDVCTKLVECGNLGTERMSVEECTEACRAQEQLYATWDDTQLRDAFDAEKSCVDESTCEALAEGVCYDSAVWSFE